MSATGEQALEVLRSIDTTLKAMLALAQQRTARAVAAQTKAIASDRELDGTYGNPTVKFSPRDWSGPSFKGLPMSECDPAFLDMLAETFDYFAQQAEAKNEMTDKGKPVAGYKRMDAARARGWAKRIRDGVHTPAARDEANQGEAWAGDDTQGGSGW